MIPWSTAFVLVGGLFGCAFMLFALSFCIREMNKFAICTTNETEDKDEN